MGGNALKNCVIIRRTRDEYKILENEVIVILLDLFVEFKIPKYFDDKPTFGDIDILYIPNEKFTIKEVAKRLNSKEYVKNGPIISFEYNNFQIDLIKTNESEIEMSHDYFSWSNFGKLVGIICCQYDLTFGHTGLYYNVTFDDNHTKILLSCVPKDIFAFLGLDYNKFILGFKTEIELFAYVSTCKFYHKSIFLNESNNNFPKKRSDTFDRFSSLISKNDNTDNPMLVINFLDILTYFGKLDEYNELYKKYHENKIIKQRFNGLIVNNITGLSDRGLGNFMKKLRSINNFREFILNNNQDTINKRITDEFNLFYQI